MTSENPAYPAPNDRTLVAPPLESLIRMVAASAYAVEGLQAVAIEVGGREGAKIAKMADTLRRGGRTNFENESALHVSSTVQEDARSDRSHREAVFGIQLPRWILLQQQRVQSRANLRRLVWFALLYGFLASVVGSYLLKVGITIVKDIGLSSDSFDLRNVSIEAHEIISGFYGFAISMYAILIVLWIGRSQACMKCLMRFGWLGFAGRAIESFWNRVPFIGSTYRTIDLAEMFESIASSLASGSTFSDAFRSAARQTQSAHLNRWLREGAAHFDQGESFASVVSRCPIQAHILVGASSVLSKDVSSAALAGQWRQLSDRMHLLMLSRIRRTAVGFLPLSILLAVAILLLGWSNFMGYMFALISGLT
jgi:hypothetical protein